MILDSMLKAIWNQQKYNVLNIKYILRILLIYKVKQIKNN